MDESKPPDPPDLLDSPSTAEDPFYDVSNDSSLAQFAEVACSVSRKRHVDDSIILPNRPPKQPKSNVARDRYSATDTGPFIVHVSRIESQPDSGTTLHPINFGLFLFKHKISNIIRDGVKRVGRNRVSVQFNSPQDANAFLSNHELIKNRYRAFIPSFNITRMGVVSGVPTDMTEDEAKTYLTVPPGCGQILKVRRISRKTLRNGISEWKPTETCVITFDGQVLPSRVFCFYTSLSVQQYIYPTIQCRKCCRFGHVEAVCRSKPRCSKCAQDHPGVGCDTPVSNANCVLCSGNHFANNKECPEYGRQRPSKKLWLIRPFLMRKPAKTFQPLYPDHMLVLLNRQHANPQRKRMLPRLLHSIKQLITPSSPLPEPLSRMAAL